MWKIFDVVPGIVWAVALVVALSIAGVSHVRMSNAKQELATYKAEVAENTRKAEAQYRAKEQELYRQTERIANDHDKRQAALAARIANTQLVAGQLRDEINRLNAQPTPTDPESAAFALEASAARKLLGSCSEEYRLVAQGADELRSQVVGLQDYATNVCKNKD